MIELTEQQWQQLGVSGEKPLRLTDPTTNQEYVLLRAKAYERLRSLLEDDLDMPQVGDLVQRNLREDDALDPLLDSYQQFAKRP